MAKLVASIEARMTSTRLPGKVLAEACGKPMLQLMIERLRFVRELDEIVVATTVNATDDPIVALANELSVDVWRGSEDDVMKRVLDAAKHHNADILVELTGDCPLIDPRIVTKVIEHYRVADVDYVSNAVMRSYPDGMDTQIFATAVLEDAFGRTTDRADHEHVSQYIYSHPERYRISNVLAPPDETYPDLRLTLDTAQDLAVIREIFDKLYLTRVDFSLRDMLDLLEQRPNIGIIDAGARSIGE